MYFVASSYIHTHARSLSPAFDALSSLLDEYLIVKEFMVEKMGWWVPLFLFRDSRTEEEVCMR